MKENNEMESGLARKIRKNISKTNGKRKTVARGDENEGNEENR